MNGQLKILFMTPKGLFKLTVMFVRLTSSPAIFQTIINKILQNLINIREVVSFIDNVIVGIKKEEEHNEAVEEAVKRLAVRIVRSGLSFF